MSFSVLQMHKGVVAFSSLYKLRHKFFSTAQLVGKNIYGEWLIFFFFFKRLLNFRLFISLHFCLFPTWWSSKEERVNGFVSISWRKSVRFCLRVVFLYVFLLFQVPFIGRIFWDHSLQHASLHVTWHYSPDLMRVLFL